MKKYVVMILIAIVLIIGGGTFAYFHFANADHGRGHGGACRTPA